MFEEPNNQFLLRMFNSSRKIIQLLGSVKINASLPRDNNSKDGVTARGSVDKLYKNNI